MDGLEDFDDSESVTAKSAPMAADDIIIEPANADEFETVYGDFNDTMANYGGSDDGLRRPYLRLNGILRNLTKTVGDTVRLRCDVAGAPVPIEFEWKKNHAPVETRQGGKRRVKIRKNEYWSKLTITKADVHDSGYYTCIASNIAGSVETTGILRVNPSTASSSNSGGGGSRDLEGEGTLLPMGGGRGGVDWLGEQGGQLNQGGCVAYGGKVCRDYLSALPIRLPPDDGLIRHLGRLEETERDLQAAMMFISNSSFVSEDCKRYSRMAACYHMFDVCAHTPSSPNKPSVLSICRRDCRRLRSELCVAEYTLAAKHDLIGKGPGKLLPDCDRLPDDPQGTCIEILGRTNDQERVEDDVNPHHFCYVGSGGKYRGVASLTETGETCLEWGSNAGRVNPLSYPELKGARNYCRNPDGRPKPWCYNSAGQEANCQLQKCPPDMFPHLTKDPTQSSTPPNDSGNGNSGGGGASVLASAGAWWRSLGAESQYALVGGGAFALLLLLFLLLCCVCRRGGKRRPRANKTSHGSMNGSLLNSTTVTGNGAATGSYYRKMNGSGYSATAQQPLASFEMSALLPPPPSHSPPPAFADIPAEIAPERLRFMDLLGEGQFGQVWKGELLDNENRADQVAIKTLKEGSSPRLREDFQQEVQFTAKLRHPNVVELLGVCLNAQPQCAVLEYMVHGDLHEFLMLRSPYAPNMPQTDEDEFRDRMRLDQSDFLHVATQIAAGMEYLAANRYVHRDLAARNCLVTDRLTIKIADFGLARDIYKLDYYQLQTKTLLPVRWMPAEAIVYGKFSETSDVWAFGVTMWEIYSYGTQPYYSFDNQQVINMIRNRYLLERPDNCPTEMYSLMVECWHESPARRPRFAELHCRLQAWALMCSPAQSAVSAQPPHRAPSVHSGTSSGGQQGRSSRHSSLLANQPPPPFGQSAALRQSALAGGSASNLPVQTLLTMNGVKLHQQQLQQAKGSPRPSHKYSADSNSPALSGSHRGVHQQHLYQQRPMYPQYGGDADSSS